ncbi:hypothetical protein [Pedobacter sp. SYP-B3415]|uniref:hypothetical protein n=1 Tax=Pedobacter sp. SYP-B3415 TaxID=2496641 RepID=UPI00101D8615|nr:hypothetical protein [Pedobacter sp. SYP-B3415]
MKKTLTLIAFFALILTAFSSCKKEEFAEQPLRHKMFGKWQVEKVTRTISGQAPVTETYNAPGDYIDFRENDDDDFEQSLDGDRTIGTWTVNIDNSFDLRYSFGLLSAKLDNISETRFQFTGTMKNSGGQTETQTFYLKR